VGEVRQSATGLTTPMKKGYQIVSSQVPQQGSLQTVLGYPPNENDTVYQWDPVAKNYKSQAYIDGAWSGDWGEGVEPPVKVGEALLIKVDVTTPLPWTRIFEIK
jgi:hypothetical protein